LPTSISGAEVRLGSVSADLAGATSTGVLWQAVPGRFLLSVPGVARYLVEGGDTITIDAEGDAEPDEVNRLMRSTPLAAVYLQRGMPVLHAAVVIPPGGAGAIVLAGDSGSGKSVLAAALWARGFQVLADGLAPLAVDDHGEPVVLPTAGELILWPDAVERLGLARSEPAACGPEGRRRRFEASDGFSARACPVASIWRLVNHNADNVEVVDIKGAARFAAISTMAHNSRIASALLDRRKYMSMASAIAASAIPMRALVRPSGRWSAGEMADTVAGARVT